MTEKPINLGENALDVFSSFVRELAILLRDKDFDAVLACGDSGSVMAVFTQYVYDEISKIMPPVVLLPTYRVENATPDELASQDKSLISQAAKQLAGLKPKNVLFVDDEIGTGSSLQMATQALMSAANVSDLNCTVLAEDDGFDKRKEPEGVKIDFRPFSKHKGELYNAIFWFIPSEYEDPVVAAIKNSDKTSDHHKWPMNILLGAPLKTRSEGIPRFTYKPQQQVMEREPRLAELQTRFQEYVRNLVSKTIQERV